MRLVFLLLLLVAPMFVSAGKIISSSDSELIVIGSSSMRNKDVARRNAVDDALLAAQEFLDGSTINSNSLYRERYNNGKYSQDYTSTIDKRTKGSTNLKYVIVREWYNPSKIFNVKLRLNMKIYKQSRVLKNRFRISELGIRGIECEKLSYQSCEYLKRQFHSSYPSAISRSSPFVIEFVVSTKLMPNNKCNADNLGGTIFISDDICMGNITIRTTLMVKESGKKASEGNVFDVNCNYINLADVSVYNGFPSIFNDNDSKRCGNVFFNRSLTALNSMVTNITR